MKSRASGARDSGRRGFTLIEVVLAILIMVGMMVVLLFFHQRLTETRNLALAEAEGVATVRLLMDQMTTELRLARASANPTLRFEGSSNSMRFHTVSMQPPGSWRGVGAARPDGMGDLLRVSYSIAGGTNLAEATGLARKEELPFAPLASEDPGTLAEVAEETEAGLDAGAGETNSLGGELGETNVVESASLDLGEPQAGADGLLTGQVRFLGLRYWNGVAWREGWSDTSLPLGVEITLSREALREGGSDPEEALGEVFRRVVYLPGADHPALKLAAGTNAPPSGTEVAP